MKTSSQIARPTMRRVFAGVDVARGKDMTVVLILRNRRRRFVKSVVINGK